MNNRGVNPWQNTNWSPAGGGTYNDTLDMFLSEDQKPKTVRNSKNLVWDPVTKTFVPAENGPVGPSPWQPDTSRDGFGRVQSAGGPNQSQQNTLYGNYNPRFDDMGRLGAAQKKAGITPRPFSGLGQSGNSFGNMKPRRPFR